MLGAFPASGRAVRLTSISITHVSNGKIACDRVHADMVGLLAQIGVLPPS